LGVRAFRDQFPTLTEPTRVIRATSRNGSGPVVLGVWMPQKQAEPKAKKGA
jgi:hypothetical protein